MTAATVARISIAPVKSLGLVHPDSVELTSYGVVGDRAFAVVDADGKLANGTKHGPLVRVRSAYDGTRLSLTLPDGTEVSDDVRLGDALRPVFYGEERGARLVGGPFAAALSEVDGSPLRLCAWTTARASTGRATARCRCCRPRPSPPWPTRPARSSPSTAVASA